MCKLHMHCFPNKLFMQFGNIVNNVSTYDLEVNSIFLSLIMKDLFVISFYVYIFNLQVLPSSD